MTAEVRPRDVNTEERLVGVTPTENEHGGYLGLAGWMGRRPEHALFRGFYRLSVLNLLYLQAQLSNAERKLDDAIELDARSTTQDAQSQSALTDWSILANCYGSGGDLPTETWKLALDVRNLLKEYTETLLRAYEMEKLPKPKRYDREELKKWMEISGKVKLYGPGDDFLENLCDLGALSKHEWSTPLTRWIGRHLGHFDDTIGHYFKKLDSSQGQTVVYDDSTLLQFSNVMVLLIASALLFMAIAVLHAISGTPGRLGAMAGFTFLFSVALAFLTSSSESDTFARVLAFAGIQVVFIAGSDSLLKKPGTCVCKV